MKQDEVSKLLGRPLTDLENTNFNLYLDIATKKLELLLCYKICCDQESKMFSAREGYRTLHTSPFLELSKVTRDGEEVASSDYQIMQNDDYHGDWYNSIVFKEKLCNETVTVEADWGFNGLPSDLQSILAGLFNQHSRAQAEANLTNKVKSKEVEDFRVTYGDLQSESDYLMSVGGTIKKYSNCGIVNVQHGSLGSNDHLYGHGIYTF